VTNAVLPGKTICIFYSRSDGIWVLRRKSTLTRLCSSRGRRAADRPSESITDSPSSKRRSNSELYRELHIIGSGAADGDQTDDLLALGDHGRSSAAREDMR